MYIAVDFDGTIVTHEYPRIGEPIDGCIETLKWLNSCHDVKLILYTMRSGKQLQEATNYLTEQGVELYAVNNNPTQSRWTSSPKIYANIYIDDAALGIPLVHNSKICKRPWVNWDIVKTILIRKLLEEKIEIVPLENK